MGATFPKQLLIVSALEPNAAGIMVNFVMLEFDAEVVCEDKLTVVLASCCLGWYVGLMWRCSTIVMAVTVVIVKDFAKNNYHFYFTFNFNIKILRFSK